MDAHTAPINLYGNVTLRSQQRWGYSTQKNTGWPLVCANRAVLWRTAQHHRDLWLPVALLRRRDVLVVLFHPSPLEADR